MSDRVIVVENGDRYEPELFDVEPTLDELKFIYPAARIIVHDLKRSQWIVVIGESLP